jgi:hypothetical protein
MIDEPALQVTLLAAIKHMKAQYELITSLGNEIAAIRQTVARLDPTFGDVLKAKRNHYAEQSRQTIQETLAEYQELIEQIEAGNIVG